MTATRTAREMDVPTTVDTTPSHADHPRVQAVLKMNDYDVVGHVATLDHADSQAWNAAIATDRHSDRLIGHLSAFGPHAQDLAGYEKDVATRIMAAKAHARDLTEAALRPSPFSNVTTSTIEVNKVTRHVLGLLSVKGTTSTATRARGSVVVTCPAALIPPGRQATTRLSSERSTQRGDFLH